MDQQGAVLAAGAAAGAALLCHIYQASVTDRRLRALADTQRQLLDALREAAPASNLSIPHHRQRSQLTLGSDDPEALFALVIAGDIGGTNSRLTLYSVPGRAKVVDGQRAPGRAVYVKKYKNEGFPTFVGIMKQFVQDAEKLGGQAHLHGNIAACCLACAGPVANNKVTMTNRGSWVIDGAEIERELHISKVRLINDFVAQGYGVLTLDVQAECEVLQDVEPVPGAPKVCIGAGTGLGECFLTASEPGAPYDVFPSEGAHAEFAPRVDPHTGEDEEFKMLQFLIKRFKGKHRVSVERIVSGPGIENVYEYLMSAYPGKIDPAVQKKYDAAAEKGQVVSDNAGTPDKPGDHLCHKTMSIFARAYGSEAGVAGLKWMPFGGLYLVGGITPKNMPWIRGESGHFLTAFHDKGRVAPLLRGVPLYAVRADDIGERGAHLAAVQLLAGVSAPGVPACAGYQCAAHDPAGHSLRPA